MPEYKCDMKGYASKYGFYTSENLSRMEAERTLQLEPEPPKESDLNNYIIQAQQQKDLRYLSFFLHHYEKMLNGRIYSFWRSDGNERYDPEHFLDYKMTCVVAVIERFSDYDSSTGADFTTYLYPFITDEQPLADPVTEKKLEFTEKSKTDFALRLICDYPDYSIPKYLKDGLVWLNKQKILV